MLLLDEPETQAQVSTAMPTSHRLDPAERAERHLRSNSYLALKNISCEYRDGVLILKGHLPTYYLKQIAQEVVAPTEGVQRISNQIEVVGLDARLTWRG